ncbi:MAG: hypothetical protein WKG07_18475 [Hymenobacter sp.]
MSSESKWQRMNGLVMLLPHGYEGQGPEHSNARPERFLQLAAENNIVVANITTPANFFHALRRQLTWSFRKPLVVMSPKSMLRHPLCVSPVEEFTGGHFREVLGDDFAEAKKVKRVLLCSGKVYFDLLEEQQHFRPQRRGHRAPGAAAPFPQKQLAAELAKYPKAKLYWVQEEPENMGYWNYHAALHAPRAGGRHCPQALGLAGHRLQQNPRKGAKGVGGPRLRQAQGSRGRRPISRQRRKWPKSRTNQPPPVARCFS